MLLGRHLVDIQQAQLEIASRFGCATKDPQPAESAGAQSACLLTLQTARLKLGQLARARLPQEDVESITPRQFRHDNALLRQLQYMHANLASGADQQYPILVQL